MILPGIRISMEALETKTARLPAVEIVKPDFTLGRSTVESIQAGLYYSNLYALTGAVERIRQAEFKGEDALVIGTGGFSRLFETAQVFDKLVPELVLLGLVRALEISTSSKERVFHETNAAEI
jgi:type III pantothenate kinase